MPNLLPSVISVIFCPFTVKAFCHRPVVICDMCISHLSRVFQKHHCCQTTIAMSLSALSRQLSQLAIRHNVTPRLKATTSMRAVQMIPQGKKIPASSSSSSSSPLLIRWQSSNGNDDPSKDAISSLAVGSAIRFFFCLPLCAMAQ